MMETQQAQGTTRANQQHTPDPAKGLEQALNLLRSKDDTQRFVGIALLKSILDNTSTLREDPAVIRKCWNAMPARFLRRLIQSSEKEMRDLAVAIVHSFVVLLPSDALGDEKLLQCSSKLLRALRRRKAGDRLSKTPPAIHEDKDEGDQEILILEILFSVASTHIGAISLASSENLVTLVPLVLRNGHALGILRTVLFECGTSEEPSIYQNLQGTLSRILEVFGKELGDSRLTDLKHKNSSLAERGSKASSYMAWLSDVLPHLSSQVSAIPPIWLQSLANLIHETISLQYATPGKRQSEALVYVVASTLHLFPTRFTTLLFNTARRQGNSADSKLLPYVFVKLILVDIRSTIPSLQETLNSPKYAALSCRLAASYDVVSAFIGYLVQCLENLEADLGSSNDDSKAQDVFLLEPDSLLSLRADISETMSLTIEYLRDRFDASIAGAAGLHPSARFTSPENPNAQLALTWDTAEGMMKDPLTLSQLRTLALWLRDDDGEDLRKEAAGIMDFLSAFYVDAQGSDVRLPVLAAMDAITSTTEGIGAFLDQDCWKILASDLKAIASSEGDIAHRGAEIISVFQNVLESGVAGAPNEAWLEVLQTTSSMQEIGARNAVFYMAMTQLSLELLSQAPSNIRRRHVSQIKQILEVCKRTQHPANDVPVAVKREIMGVMEGYQDLLD